MKEGLLVLPHGEGQARKYLNVIGQSTSIQVEDMNGDAMRRPYRRHVQRLEEMERILRYLFEEMDRMDCDIVKTQIDKFLDADAVQPYVMDEVEAKLKKLYVHWTELMSNDEKLTLARNHVAEEVEVMRLATKMVVGSEHKERNFGATTSQPLLNRTLSSVAGVIALEDQARFARAVFRASRGNAFTHLAPINALITDPKTGARVNKTVFVVFFQGSSDSQSALQERIGKVCATFAVNTYAWPSTPDEASSKLKALEASLREKTTTLVQCEDLIRQEAAELLNPQGPGRSSTLEEWRQFACKEKSIYAMLNMFEEAQTHMRAYCWFAATDEENIREVLANVAGVKDKAVLTPVTNSTAEPPTYIRTNDFTDPWQTVINTYGIPRYQEANPALFACVSFPFIFGMMYGDVGHGSLLMITGAYLVFQGKALLEIKDIGETLYWVRYLLLQLGIYATFAGFLYNDMFSVGLQLFDTRYAVAEDGTYSPTWDALNEGNGAGGPYPFGVDWAWHGASNELMFMNSMKMKLSVLFGVLQMTLGVFLRFGNAIFFKSKIDFFFECIPMLIFMLCFFGWMDFMILYKWLHPIATGPPGIINSLICMAMGPMGVGQTDEFPLWEATDGGMSSVHLSTILMNCAVVSIPWLLIFKPYLLKRENDKLVAEQAAAGVEPKGNRRKTMQAISSAGGEDMERQESDHVDAGGGGNGHGHGEFNMGETIIHQVIETIEYVLGTVSHTASYLRIWALSLAHQQLSQVFYSKTIGMALVVPAPWNGLAIYIMFCVWFAITFAVLLGMDVLECFLHTLRLHWVEFDSKFFKADGYNFEPFSVRRCIANSEV